MSMTPMEIAASLQAPLDEISMETDRDVPTVAAMLLVLNEEGDLEIHHSNTDLYQSVGLLDAAYSMARGMLNGGAKV